MRVFPSRFHAANADAIGAIAGEYLADMYRRRGIVGLLVAWQRLAADVLANGCAEWHASLARRIAGTPRYVVPMILGACALDAACNFAFGNDLGGTIAWASAIFAISFVLGACLPSRSLGLIVFLVVADTIAGSLSVYATHHNFDSLFANTLRWIPLAFFTFAAGSYGGSAARRLAARIYYC